MTQYSLIAFAVLELVLALLIITLVLYVSYWLISKYIIRKYQISHDNIAFAILCSAMLFAIAHLMEGVIDPITSVFRQLIQNHQNFEGAFLASIKYVLVFMLIAMTISLLVNVVAVRLYISLTKIDEFAEIQKNNIAIAIITATILVSIALFTKEPAIQVMEAIIPYPKLPFVR